MQVYRVDVEGKSLSGLFGFYIAAGTKSFSVIIVYRSRHGYEIRDGSYFEEVFARSSAAAKTRATFDELELTIAGLESSPEGLFCEAVDAKL